MVVVITGATKGIGRGIAEKLAGEGHDLAICGRTKEALTDLEKRLSGSGTGPRIITRALDVRDRPALVDFAKYTLAEFGHIDVLINNAGIFRPGSILDESSDSYDAVIDTNLHSAYLLTKAVLPSMITRRSGHIINMCSVASIQAYPNGGSYAISKHALLGFGRTLREEVREYGIRVTNILPGATRTDSWAGVDLPEGRLMDVSNIVRIVMTAIELDQNAVMEEIVIRPILT